MTDIAALIKELRRLIKDPAVDVALSPVLMAAANALDQTGEVTDMVAASLHERTMRIARLICYEKCRASVCVHNERCCNPYPAPGYSYFEGYIAEARKLIGMSAPPKDAGLLDRIEGALNPAVADIVKRHTLSECRSAIQTQAAEIERLEKAWHDAECAWDKLDAKRNRLLADLHGMQDGSLLRDLRAENERLHERLEDNHEFRLIDGKEARVEVKPGSIPDGIECRDETIKLQDERIDRQSARIAELKADLEHLRSEEKWRIRVSAHQDTENDSLRERIAELEAERDGVRTQRNEAYELGKEESKRETIEKCLAAVPGGNICDPQDIADRIRDLGK